MSSAKGLRGLLVNNLTLKVSSLVLASILWFHATTLQTYEEVLTVRLEVQGLPDTLVLLTPPPDRAQVAFRGKGDQLWWLFVRQPRIVLSGEELQPGQSMIALYPSNVQLPGGLDVQVVDIVAPRTLQLQVDRLRRKTVPVVVETTGLPAPGFVRVTDEFESDPPHVTLEGPWSVIEDLHQVRTEPLDVSNAKGDVSRKVRLDLPVSPRLSASAEVVNVRARFERLVHRVLRVQPGYVSPPRQGWHVEPDTVRIHLWAPASLEDSLRSLAADRVRPLVNVPRAARDSTMLDLALRPPPWLKQWDMDPSRVMLLRSAS